MKTQHALIFLFVLGISSKVAAQSVAINTDGSAPDASAMLDVSSTTKGLLIPRVSSSDREAITSPAVGLMIYDTTEAALYYYTGAAWQRLDAVVVGEDAGDLPSSPYVGQLYLDTSTSSDRLFIYTSSGQWSQVSLTSPGSIY